MTPKELAFLWMDEKLSSEKVNPEDHEMLTLAGKKVPPSTVEKAKEKVHEEVAKWRTRYSDYLAKREVK